MPMAVKLATVLTVAFGAALPALAGDFAEPDLPWTQHSSYEDDHRVPLCLAGADVAENRWPQPFGEALVKDELERKPVARCAAALPLAVAQQWFLRDWVAGLLRGVRPRADEQIPRQPVAGSRRGRARMILGWV